MKTNQKKSRGLRWWLTTAIVVVVVAIAALAIALPFALIYAPLPEADGIGLALQNRMLRAAAFRIKEI